MRGSAVRQSGPFGGVSPESRVPRHPVRASTLQVRYPTHRERLLCEQRRYNLRFRRIATRNPQRTTNASGRVRHVLSTTKVGRPDVRSAGVRR